MNKNIQGQYTGATGSGGRYIRGNDGHYYWEGANGHIERSIYDKDPAPKPQPQQQPQPQQNSYDINAVAQDTIKQATSSVASGGTSLGGALVGAGLSIAAAKMATDYAKDHPGDTIGAMKHVGKKFGTVALIILGILAGGAILLIIAVLAFIIIIGSAA